MIAAMITQGASLGGGGPLPSAPTAIFSIANLLNNLGDTNYFYDASTGAPTNWEWQINGATFSTLQNPSIYCDMPGVFSVTLTVSNAFGSNTSAPQTYFVNNY